MCRLWKMWNFFADFAAVAASSTVTSGSQQAPAATKQSGRCDSRLPTGLSRVFMFSGSVCQRLPAFTDAPVVLRSPGVDRSQSNPMRVARARDYAA
jgi:hypothetical protein